MFPQAAVLEGLRLSQLQRRLIFTDVLGGDVPAADEPLSAEVALTLWIADLLRKLEFLSAEQREVTIKWVLPALRAAAETYETPTIPIGLHQLAFADGRFVACTGLTGFLDLETGLAVDKLPQVPVEGLAYNLNELFRRKAVACRRPRTPGPGRDHATRRRPARPRPPSLDGP